MTSTADLIAAYRREGGKVTMFATARAQHTRRNWTPPATQNVQIPDDHDPALVDALRADFRAMRDQFPDAPRHGPDWWARYQIEPLDPWREIAEAGALVCIARDEGAESVRLFRKELCRGKP